MKRQESYWERFEKTGGIMDYLNYTACARESCGMPEACEVRTGCYDADELRDAWDTDYEDEEEEVDEDDWDAHREWNGAFGYADGRIR